jgi:rRNA biogenesis protein RRP5
MCREENEKFNVWVAWLNLEATYGTPSPTESLMSLFKKAVTYCEPKKLYFALLGEYRRCPNHWRFECWRFAVLVISKHL